MQYTLLELRNRQLINVVFTVHPRDVQYVQEAFENAYGDEYIETTIPNYWAAALQGISVSSEAKKQRLPRIRFF